ncbi:DDE superfamily endonuclease [Carpediemonas membranifera]|uniref:DDE superfamily endonuclease n=1 Tax=Carpediemonas membranifera TaxID=201153 RepID=A0A8J6BZA7_9EUKA|nr:DDE superfamily endonuclease [Carpediemonas membranifera]|eukprot:KAG9395346.1 DDE superfamily endonuclease [Carpediemonas membranifera]
MIDVPLFRTSLIFLAELIPDEFDQRQRREMMLLICDKIASRDVAVVMRALVHADDPTPASFLEALCSEQSKDATTLAVEKRAEKKETKNKALTGPPKLTRCEHFKVRPMKFDIEVPNADIYDLIYEAAANIFDSNPAMNPMNKKDLSITVDDDDLMKTRKTQFKMVRVEAYGRVELTMRWYPCKDSHKTQKNLGKFSHISGNSAEELHNSTRSLARKTRQVQITPRAYVRFIKRMYR